MLTANRLLRFLRGHMAICFYCGRVGCSTYGEAHFRATHMNLQRLRSEGINAAGIAAENTSNFYEDGARATSS